MTSVARLGGMLGGLGGGLVLLDWAGGDPRLAGPLLRDPAGWWRWAVSGSPVDHAFALTRIALTGLTLLVLVSVVAGVIARLAGAVRTVRVLDRFTLPAVRRAVDAALGWSLVVSTVAAPAAQAAPAASTAVTAPADPDPSGSDRPGVLLTAAVVTAPSGAGATRELVAPPPAARGAARTQHPPVLRRVDPPPPHDTPPRGTETPPTQARTSLQPSTERRSGDVADGARSHDAPDAVARPPAHDAEQGRISSDPSAPASPTAGVWRVAPGDHLWAIAEVTVAAVTPDPDERTVRRYWRKLITANRDRLVDPRNPDLILPGQVLALPGTEEA